MLTQNFNLPHEAALLYMLAYMSKSTGSRNIFIRCALCSTLCWILSSCHYQLYSTNSQFENRFIQPLGSVGAREAKNEIILFIRQPLWVTRFDVRQQLNPIQIQTQSECTDTKQYRTLLYIWPCICGLCAWPCQMTFDMNESNPTWHMGVVEMSTTLCDL